MRAHRMALPLAVAGILACGGAAAPSVEATPVGPLGDVVDLQSRLPSNVQRIQFQDAEPWSGTIAARGCNTELEERVWTTADASDVIPDQFYLAGIVVAVTSNESASHVTWSLSPSADPSGTVPFTVKVECVVDGSRVVWEYQGYVSSADDFAFLHEGVGP